MKMGASSGNFREYTLDNGLKVGLQETPTETIAGRLRVFHGALGEKPGEEGLAHFLEHVLMSGGSRRFSPEEADEIKARFGEYNAYTRLDETLFPVDMLAEDVELYLDFISDMTFNPRFDQTRLEQERQRVLRETADEKSQSRFGEDREFLESFYGKNSPHIYLILGREEVVGKASAEDLAKFHSRGYHANNMDLILVGALPKNIEILIQDRFSGMPRGTGKRFQFPRNKQLEQKVVLHTLAPDLCNHSTPEESSAQLYISFFAPTDQDEDFYAAKMMTSILGRGPNSRLFKTISQNLGLSYSVGASYDGSNNKGQIQVWGTVHAQRSEEAMDAVFSEFVKMRSDLIDEEELDRLKRDSLYKIAKTFETNAGHANAIALKWDKDLTPQIHLERTAAVTPEMIREAASRYLPADKENGKYVLLLRDPLKDS